MTDRTGNSWFWWLGFVVLEVLSVCQAYATPPAQAECVIYDGDVGPDPTDAGSVVMAINMHNKGEISLLGLFVPFPEPRTVTTMDIIENYYTTLGEIPVGVYGDLVNSAVNEHAISAEQMSRISAQAADIYNEEELLADRHPSLIRPEEIRWDGVELFKELLSIEPTDPCSGNVIILLEGFHYMMDAVLRDAEALELVNRHVKRIVIMGGTGMGLDTSPTPEEETFYKDTYGTSTIEGRKGLGDMYIATHYWFAGEPAMDYNSGNVGVPNVAKRIFDVLNESYSYPNGEVLFVPGELGWKVPVGAGYNAMPWDAPVRLIASVNNPLSVLNPACRLYDATLCLPKDGAAFDELAVLAGVDAWLNSTFSRNFIEVEYDMWGTPIWRAAAEPERGDQSYSYLTFAAGVDPLALAETIEQMVAGDAPL